MKKILKIIAIILIVLTIVGGLGYLVIKNIQLNKSYEAATKQVTQLQAKLDAVGTFADVFTVKTSVKMGQEIKEEDLILQTVPTSSIPNNVITNKESLIGNYYRIGFEPGVTITSDFITVEEYIGAVYDRDVFLDSIPVGTKVGDYLDIRVVLPGGEEFVVLKHKRVNARYDNAVKMNFDESDLWLYTSMNVDRALYKDVGFKIYSTKYVDPGAHEDVVAYYPVRKEVVDIMNINANLTEVQRASIWNENLRTSIDAKLAFYADPLNRDSGKLANGVQDEQNRYNAAERYYESLLEELNNTGGDPNNVNSNSTGLVDPNNSNNSGVENIGNLEDGGISDAPTVDGLQDADGNSSVIKSQDYLDNLGDNLFDDEAPVQ